MANTAEINENSAYLPTRWIGQCLICGRELANSASIERGIGPICAERVAAMLGLDGLAGVTADASAYAAALARLAEHQVVIDTSAPSVEQSHALLRSLSRGLPESGARAVLDALIALGYSAVARLAGARMELRGYDGASLAPASLALVADRLVLRGSYCPAALADLRAVPGRRWDGASKINTAPATVASARALAAVATRWYPLCTVEPAVLALAAQPLPPAPQSPAPVQTTPQTQQDAPSCPATMTADGKGGWLVRTPYNQAFVDGLKQQLPFQQRRWQADAKAWWIADDGAATIATLIKRTWPTFEAPAGIAATVERTAQAKALATATTSTEQITLPGGQLYPYQVAGVQALELRGSMLIGDDMGLGKTLQAIAYVLRDRGQRMPVLCVTPAAVKINWARQWAKWSGSTVTCAIVEGNDLRPCSVDGERLRRNGKVEQLVGGLVPEVLIINYDLLRRHQQTLQQIGWQVIILDESHLIKESKSARSAAAAAIAAKIPHRILLTGTPMLNRPRELWHQLHVVDPQAWSRFTSFAYRYCNPQQVWTGRKMVTSFDGASCLDELNARVVGTFMVRRRKVDVLRDLPAKRSWSTALDVTDEQRAEYDRAATDYETWAAEHGQEVNEYAARLQRLTALRVLAVKSKCEAAVEHISSWRESTGEQCVVWGHHHEALDHVAKALADAGARVVRIDGSSSTGQRQAAVDAMRAGQADVLVASILAAGVGIDGLQERCQQSFFIERTWRPADLQQAEDRLYRIGQQSTVSCEYLDLAQSIDTQLARLLDHKAMIGRSAVDGTGEHAALEEASQTENLIARLHARMAGDDA